eukprot:scaffold29647_cov145-Isochrysis_galbana.AAC.7
MRWLEVLARSSPALIVVGALTTRGLNAKTLVGSIVILCHTTLSTHETHSAGLAVPIMYLPHDTGCMLASDALPGHPQFTGNGLIHEEASVLVLLGWPNGLSEGVLFEAID